MEAIMSAFAKFNLNPIIIILIIAGGFWAKRYLDQWKHIYCGTKIRIEMNDAWKTLIVGTILTAVCIGLWAASDTLVKGDIIKCFYSYVFATSFYELIVGPITKMIQKAIGSSDDTK